MLELSGRLRIWRGSLLSWIDFSGNSVFQENPSFLLIATGCGVPGVMASRTIENEQDRRLTIMVTTFMPCSAKLPIIALVAGAFFLINLG